MVALVVVGDAGVRVDHPHGPLQPLRGHAHRDCDIRFPDQRSARGQFDARDDDVVGGVEADCQVGGLEHASFQLNLNAARAVRPV